MTELQPLLERVRLAVFDVDRPVLTRPGGAGCVPEFCDRVLEAQRS